MDFLFPMQLLESSMSKWRLLWGWMHTPLNYLALFGLVIQIVLTVRRKSPRDYVFNKEWWDEYEKKFGKV